MQITYGSGAVRLFLGASLLLMRLLLGPHSLWAQIPGRPTVVLYDSQVTTTNALINGTVRPNGLPTGFYLRWGLTAAYGNTSDYGETTSGSQPSIFQMRMTNLSPHTVYHYQIVATNSAGDASSADLAIGTLAESPNAPTAITRTASAITQSAATIGGNVNPNGLDTTWYFQWGTTTAYGNVLPAASVPGQYLSSIVGGALSNLNAATIYHYQLVATNSAGSTVGDDQSFTTHGVFSTNGHTFTYATNDGLITIAGYSGPGGAVDIPGVIAGLPVTVIGDAAFSRSSVASVIVPQGITTIGNQAFLQDRSLTNVTLPNSVAYIEDQAFALCPRLAAFIIPDSVTSVGASAFEECSSLAEVTVGRAVMVIGGQAFYACTSLSRVTIPDSVSTLGYGGSLFGDVFGGCTNLTNVVLGKGLARLGAGSFNSCQKLVGVYFRGNTPTITGVVDHGRAMFYGAPLAIVYYLPETTGWHTTFVGARAMLWNPQPQTGDGSFGIKQDVFGFNVAGTPDIPLVIEACNDLPAGLWIPLQSCTLTNGLIYFSDSAWAHYGGRFYRIRSP